MTAIRHSFRGFWVPYGLFEHPDLGIVEKFLIIEIRYLDSGKGCCASNAYLADVLRVSEKTIANKLTKLRKDGWILTKKSTGRTRWLKVNPRKWYEVESAIEEDFEEPEKDTDESGEVVYNYKYIPAKINTAKNPHRAGQMIPKSGFVNPKYEDIDCISNNTSDLGNCNDIPYLGNDNFPKQGSEIPYPGNNGFPKQGSSVFNEVKVDFKTNGSNSNKNSRLNGNFTNPENECIYNNNIYYNNNIPSLDIISIPNNLGYISRSLDITSEREVISSIDILNKKDKLYLTPSLSPYIHPPSSPPCGFLFDTGGTEKPEEKPDPIDEELFGENGLWKVWIAPRRGTKKEVMKAYRSVRLAGNVEAIKAGAEAYMHSPYVTSRIEMGEISTIKTLPAWLRARRWEENGTGAWDEPCLSWKQKQREKNRFYVGPCQEVNMAPRDGTLG